MITGLLSMYFVVFEGSLLTIVQSFLYMFIHGVWLRIVISLVGM